MLNRRLVKTSCICVFVFVLAFVFVVFVSFLFDYPCTKPKKIEKKKEPMQTKTFFKSQDTHKNQIMTYIVRSIFIDKKCKNLRH